VAEYGVSDVEALDCDTRVRVSRLIRESVSQSVSCLISLSAQCFSASGQLLNLLWCTII
jgi:hypothetical protein